MRHNTALNPFRFASMVVVVGLALGACGGSDDDAAEPADGAATDVTTAEVGGGDEATTETSVAASDDAPLATDAAVTTPDEAQPDAGGDPAIFALSELPDTEVCALTPKADLEAIVGTTLDEGSGLAIEGLGTNCLFYGAEDFDLQAKVEFSILSWADTAGLAEYAVEGVPAPTECSAGGLDALCIEAYTVNDFETGATVYVKLGSDADLAMAVEAAGGVDVALAVAELALSNLSIG